MSRIRTNLITNRMANGAPTVSNGLVISGVTTVTTLDLNGDIDVDGHTNLDNVSIAGVSTFSEDTKFIGAISGRDLQWDKSDNSLEFLDYTTARFGTDNNLTIYHNAGNNNSYISENGVGSLLIQASDLYLTNTAGEYYVICATDGRVQLNFNNDEKLRTTNTGTKITSGVSGSISNILQLDHNGNSNGDGGKITFSRAGTIRTEIESLKNETSNNETDIIFRTTAAGSVGERLRITSDGSLIQSSTGSFTIAKGTTAQRPSGVDGMIRFNTTLDQTEEYRDSAWHGLSNKSTVTGGNTTTSGGYTIHTFTSSGTLSVTGSPKTGVDYLLVAGGGGGGDTRAGGGGGGGMTVTTGATIQPGSYTITVGAGGAGGTSSADGTDGGATSLGSIASVVGGGGGGGQARVGRSGGSGGGGSDGQNGASGTSGQGNSGGNSTGSTGGGGGGGKGGQGYQGASSLVGGHGGAAGANNYSGSNINYSGGGGGGSRDNGTYGNGGGGGAGNGGQNNSNVAGNGSANQGGGGGGGARLHGSAGSTYNGGAGGSGIVIIRYLT